MHDSANPYYAATISTSVLLFFSLMLAVPSGYSYGSGLLLLTSIAFLMRRKAVRCPPSGEDKRIIYALLAVFVVALSLFILHGNSPKTLDQSLRALLAIPVLLLLLNVPPRLPYMFTGLVIGTLAACVIAMWQVHYLGIIRATGFVTSAIPFGNMALMMSMLCLAGMFWASTQGRRAGHWRVALLLGVVAGAYCSALSGSRGGWLALPVIISLFFIGFARKENASRSIAVIVAAALAVALFLTIPDSTVRTRFDAAASEVHTYMQDSNAVTAVGARLEAWRAAAINIKQKPFLGWSHKEYSAQLQRQVAEKQVHPYVIELSNSHNNYLEVLIYQGILGLFALLTLLVVPFWYFCKRLRSVDLTVRVLAVSGASFQASIAIFCATQVFLGRNNGIIFFVITLAILWASMRDRETTINLS